MRLRRHAGVRGFTAVELLVAMVLATIVLLFAIPYLNQIYERDRMKSVVREVHALVLATRMEAVKRNQNAILSVDVDNRRLVGWVDNLPYNFIQDPGERVTHQYQLPRFVVFRQTPSGPVNGADVVSFDTYNGNASLVDRIVFRGDGSVVAPQAINSIPPVKPDPYTANVPYTSVDCNLPGQCRGIYMADRRSGGTSRNVFRISVDDFGQTGRTSLLKWIPRPQGGNPGEWNFVPPPWKWQD